MNVFESLLRTSFLVWGFLVFCLLVFNIARGVESTDLLNAGKPMKPKTAAELAIDKAVLDYQRIESKARVELLKTLDKIIDERMKAKDLEGALAVKKEREEYVEDPPIFTNNPIEQYTGKYRWSRGIIELGPNGAVVSSPGSTWAESNKQIVIQWSNGSTWTVWYDKEKKSYWGKGTMGDPGLLEKLDK